MSVLNIESKRVSELLEGRNVGTHIEDMEVLYQSVLEYARIQHIMQVDSILLDFTGYTIPDIDIVKQTLQPIEDEFKLRINCEKWALPGMTSTVNGYEILKILEEGDCDINKAFESTYIDLCALIENHLKHNNHCLLDFSSLQLMPNIATTSPTAAQLRGTECGINRPQTIIVLVKLKAKFGEKLEFQGLNFHANSKLAYALNYFTMPHCETVEEVYDFVASAYKKDDLIFFNTVEITKSDTAKIKEYNARRVEQLVTIQDVFQIAEIDNSNLELGIIVDIKETGVSVLPVKIKSSSNQDELNRGRFTYNLTVSPTIIHYEDLIASKETGVINRVIHGADMINDAPKLYDILSELNLNPPRVREIYYTEGRHALYEKYLRSLLDETEIKPIDFEPTIENISKATDIGQAYFNPTDLL